MNLVVDIGNTRVKLALFEGDKLIEFFHLENFEKQNWQQIFLKFPEIKSVIVSSTRKSEAFDFLPKEIFTLVFTIDTPLPIFIDYETPETLGKDRVAAAVGCSLLFPKKKALVIDAGTCVTYEYVDSDMIYQGGGISPGLQMRFDAMHHFTGNLPQLSFQKESTELVGKSTNEAMFSGVWKGMLAEIDGVIEEYKNNLGVEVVLLTGGDAQSFEKQLKNTIFAAPKLVLKGLNHILEYNVKSL